MACQIFSGAETRNCCLHQMRVQTTQGHLYELFFRDRVKGVPPWGHAACRDEYIVVLSTILTCLDVVRAIQTNTVCLGSISELTEQY